MDLIVKVESSYLGILDLVFWNVDVTNKLKQRFQVFRRENCSSKYIRET